MHVYPVLQTNMQYRMLQKGFPLVECNSKELQGGMGLRYFYLTPDQKIEADNMHPQDTFNLIQTVKSPVWGDVTVRYFRNSNQLDNFLPCEESIRDLTRGTYNNRRSFSSYSQVIITTQNGTILQNRSEEEGESCFYSLLQWVKEMYCSHTYRFDPSTWSFLPLHRLAELRIQTSMGLSAFWNKGEIVGFDYKLSINSITERWNEGVFCSEKGILILPPPTATEGIEVNPFH